MPTRPTSQFSQAIASEHANSFALVRVIAAMAVIYGHSFALSRSPVETLDPAKLITEYYLSGTIAVAIFFLVSGIFVSQSLDRDRNLIRFAIRRLVRIWPGLFACLIVSVCIAVAYSKLPWAEVWSSRSIYYWYVINGLRLDFDYFIPGTFEGRAIEAVNGSIWSLILEVRMYVILSALAALGLIFNRFSVVLVAMCLVVAGFTRPSLFEGVTPLVRHAFVPCLYFLAGVVIYVFREQIRGLGILSVLGLAAFLACEGLAREIFLHAFIIASVLWFGTSPIPAPYRVPVDYSYGIYLYGFPIQQVVATIWPSTSANMMTLISIPAAVGFAAISWHVIEQPALRLGRQFVALIRIQ